MRAHFRFAVAAVAIPAMLSTRVAAQQGQQATLILSVGLGVHAGHDLWTIDSQPLSVLATPTTADTLRLGRSVSSGIIATFAATYFPSDHVGIHGGLTYLDIEMDNSCAPVVPYQLDTEEVNRQVCDNLGGSVSANSTLLIAAGVTLRALSRGRTTPYVRAGAGYAIHSKGTLGVASSFALSNGQVATRQVIAEESAKVGSPTFQLAAGITQPIGTGYQLRLEVRDDLFGLERATGAANGLGNLKEPPPARVETRWYHHVSLTLGLDIILERRRGRRY